MFRAAYGSEKHEDYYVEMGEKARLGQLVREDIVRLRHELEVMAQQGTLPHALLEVRKAIDDLAARQASTPESATVATAEPVSEARG